MRRSPEEDFSAIKEAWNLHFCLDALMLYIDSQVYQEEMVIFTVDG